MHRWAGELHTLADDEVPGRLEQIAALGDSSFPTLVAALHSDRQIVAENASLVLQREVGELELRSTKETSRLVADLATELAHRSDAPGPYSGPGSMWLATRILLWPVDRKLVDGERLVADCELIIRSAKPLSRELVAEAFDDDRSVVVGNTHDLADSVSPVAGGALPVQLTEAPLLPPQDTRVTSELHSVAIAEPQYFAPAQAPSVYDARPIQPANDDTETQSLAHPPATDSRQSREVRQNISATPRETAGRIDLKSMSDLDVMQKLAGNDEQLIRDAVDELYRRGFQTKHFRLAELLVDSDPGVRLRLVESLPQIPGIDSRPWLLWLSRDQDPAVRKAAVAVIATSSDTTLQKRIRELEREETDEEVLQAVRQILNSRQTNSIR